MISRRPAFAHWFSGVGDYPAEHGGNHRFSVNGEVQTIPGQRTPVITDRAIAFLRDRDEDAPFFLHIGYFGTHNPWRGQPERLAAAYRGSAFDGLLDQPAYPFGAQALESTLPTRLNPREALAQYFAAVAHIDEADRPPAGRAGSAAFARQHADSLHLGSWSLLRASRSVGQGQRHPAAQHAGGVDTGAAGLQPSAPALTRGKGARHMSITWICFRRWPNTPALSTRWRRSATIPGAASCLCWTIPLRCRIGGKCNSASTAICAWRVRGSINW